jgi:hypothetical protein
VGINRYSSEEVNDLSGCVNDALDIKGMLTEKFGFYESNIRLLTNESASRQNILSALSDWLFESVRSGDLVIFYYSGHGSYTSDLNGDEEDGLDETIVPSDRYDIDSNGDLVNDLTFP